MKKFALFTLAAVIALPLAGNNVIASEEKMAEAEVAVDPKLARKGKKVAVRQCVACHDITATKQNKVGPPLWGIYGQSAASVEGYAYSEAQLGKKDSIIWDQATLDQYLQDPKSLVPDNKMAFPIVGNEMSDKQRMWVIEFLKSLK